MIILSRDYWTLYQRCLVGKETNIGSRLLLYKAFKFFFQGEHNATYTVSKSDTGLKFQKIRHKHPVSNARASYVKVQYSILLLSYDLNLSIFSIIISFRILSNVLQAVELLYFKIEQKHQLLQFKNNFFSILCCRICTIMIHWELYTKLKSVKISSRPSHRRGLTHMSVWEQCLQYMKSA